VNALQIVDAARAWLHSAFWRPRHEHRLVRAVNFVQALGNVAPSEFSNDFAKNVGA